jgi:hypothetical protein
MTLLKVMAERELEMNGCYNVTNWNSKVENYYVPTLPRLFLRILIIVNFASHAVVTDQFI